jgi:DNA polymerase-3 subunit alpha
LFVHLHNHTEFSLLDGFSNISRLVSRCKELGMPALAITDHGNMSGVLSFYSECLDQNIKPIIGCEVYLSKDGIGSRNSSDKPYHLVLLAKNNIGYKNLLKMSTISHLKGFYRYPRLDWSVLADHKDGIIALSGCLGGPLARPISEGDREKALENATVLKDIFGEDFYIELQIHPKVSELIEVNKVLIDFSKILNVQLVATGDSHYTYPTDYELHDIKLCIATNSTLNNPKRFKMEGEDYYLKSPDEMSVIFSQFPEAIENTIAIANKCDIDLQFDRVELPQPNLPEGTDSQYFLEQLCWDGIKNRNPSYDTQYIDRLEYELRVIADTGFANYFLVVWDIISFAREQDILFAIRGSAASSLVLYCLNVTNIDPLNYDLVFERFLNIERKEMPDIDMDFQDDRRDEIIQYVARKYGQEHVAQIITFGTLGPRAAVRDVGRAMSIPLPDVDKIAKLIPPRATTVQEALNTSNELRNIAQADIQSGQLLNTAEKMQGLVRHAGTHAAGVVISAKPLTEYVPLQRPIKSTDETGIAMTQFSMEHIGELGLLKMDILGLANLTTIQKSIKLIHERRNDRINLLSIRLDDKATFELLSSGETTEVFQLEGQAMRKHIKELVPTTFMDIAAMVALYRPGPMEHIPAYIAAKNGEQEIRYPHPDLKDILKETHGIIVYQDQVLFIVRKFAGYSLGQADIFRKAMGKKVPEIMVQERQNFINGAISEGYSESEAESIFDLIEPFAGYAFNKSHSVSYALIAYWTAYLKANYTIEYMVAVLNSRIGNIEKLTSVITECRRLGIPVLPPDISTSYSDFSIEDDDGVSSIRFGLGVVKNVGALAIESVTIDRDKNGKYKDFGDFLARVALQGLNRRSLESLIKVGTFDSTGIERNTLLGNLDRIMRLSQEDHRSRKNGQGNMFDLFGEEISAPLNGIELVNFDNASDSEKSIWEKEHIGITLSSKMTQFDLTKINSSKILISCVDIGSYKERQLVTFVGQVIAVNERLTRGNRPFAIISMQLLDGIMNVIVWENVLKKIQSVLEIGNLLQVVGKVRFRDEELSVHCDQAIIYEHESITTPASNQSLVERSKIQSISKEDNKYMIDNYNSNPLDYNSSDSLTDSSIPNFKNSVLKVIFNESDDPLADEVKLKKALKILHEYPGKNQVNLEVLTTKKTILLAYDFTVDGNSAMNKIEELLGPNTCIVI